MDHSIVVAVPQFTQSGTSVRHYPPMPAIEHGEVRLGGQGPLFRAPAVTDAGVVRLGGQGPLFR